MRATGLLPSHTSTSSPNHLDVSTKPSFQVTNVNGFHIALIADVTMLVILTRALRACSLHRIGVEIAFSPFLPYSSARAFIATSRTPPPLPSGLECRDRRLSRG